MKKKMADYSKENKKTKKYKKDKKEDNNNNDKIEDNEEKIIEYYNDIYNDFIEYNMKITKKIKCFCCNSIIRKDNFKRHQKSKKCITSYLYDYNLCLQNEI